MVQLILKNTQRAMERKTIEVTLRDKEADWVREQTCVNDILAEINEKKSAWAAHVMRSEDYRRSLKGPEMHFMAVL